MFLYIVSLGQNNQNGNNTSIYLKGNGINVVYPIIKDC